MIPVVILAGGFGTRLSEETDVIPKPMVKIGDKPILWHIMKIYSHYGLRDFIICLGYKGEVIKDYFVNYFLMNSDITVNLATNDLTIHKNTSEDWRVTLVDTGLNTLTGGRVKRVAPYLKGRFLLTYGDGVSDVNIKEVIEFHDKSKTIGTVTAVRPTGRFGAIYIEDGLVRRFTEKPQEGEGWINGGFFVFEREFIEYIDDDWAILEQTPLESLAQKGQLSAYKHYGFWQCMDTLREKKYLNALWEKGEAPWKLWED